MTSKFMSRKFLIACATLVATTAGLFFGVLSGEHFVTAITLILGLYSAANGTIKVAKIAKDKDIEE